MRNLPQQMRSSCFRKTLSLEIMPGSRPPFQGDSLSVRLPRAKAPTPQSLRRGTRFQDTGAPKRSEGGLGYSVFALRAMAECPNSKARCLQHPETRELQATPLQSLLRNFGGLPRVGWASRPSTRGIKKTGETPIPLFPPPKSSCPLTDARSVREGLPRLEFISGSA